MPCPKGGGVRSGLCEKRDFRDRISRHLKNFGKFWEILRKIRSVENQERPDRAGILGVYLSPYGKGEKHEDLRKEGISRADERG